MCWSSSNLKGLILLGALSGNKMGSIFYGSSPLQRDSKLWKKKQSHLVRSGCWGRQLCFPWIPLECGSWCLNQHFLLAASEIVLLHYFLWASQSSLCLGRNLKKSEEAVQRTEREMEENEKEMKKLTAEMTTLEDKATEVMNECKQAEVSPGKSGRGVKSSLCPTDTRFSAEQPGCGNGIFSFFILTWKFILTQFRKKFTPGLPKQVAEFLKHKFFLHIKTFLKHKTFPVMWDFNFPFRFLWEREN